MKRSTSGTLSGVFLLFLALEWLFFALENAVEVDLHSQIEVTAFLLVSLTAGGSGFLIWSARGGQIPDRQEKFSLQVWSGWFFFLLFCLWLRLNPQPAPGAILYPFARLAEMAEWFYLFPVTTLFFFTFSKIQSRASRWAAWFALVIALALLTFKVKTDGSLVFPLDSDQFPVLWQLALAVVISGLLILLLKRFGSNRVIDLGLFILIWVCAGLIWASSPIGEDYYSLQPAPPTYRVMPRSDAEIYDYEAARIALGHGEVINLASRGILLEFYAALKLIIGFDSQNLMTVQTGFLGVIPALIFLIGRQLESRPAGLLAALLVIAKERNAIVSDLDFLHPESLMTEPLMQAGVLLMIVWLIHSIRSKPFWFNWLVYGGLAGIFINVRPNAAALLILPLIYWLIKFKRQPRRILKFSMALALGFVLAVSSIVIRNIATGNNPFFFSAKFGILTDKLGLPEEVGDFFSPPKYSVNKQVRGPFAGENQESGNVPALSFSTLTNGLSRMMIHTLNITPHYLSGEWIAGNEEVDPNQLLTPQRLIHFLTILLNLILILTGIRALTSRDWEAGFVPLAIFLFYLPTVFLSSYAHVRHLAPIENIALIYYSAGLMAGISGLLPKLELQSDPPAPPPRLATSWIVPLALLVAMALPGVEFIAPKASVENITAANLGSVSSTSLEVLKNAGISKEELSVFLLGNPGAELIRGQIFFPQFKSDKLFGRSLPTSLPHLEFRLADSYYVTLAYLPLEQSPRRLENGETVIMLVCADPERSKLVRGLRLILIDDLVVLPGEETSTRLECGESQ